ncbi:MAG: GNAT family N-acetyltransferase [Rhodanobacteraceae bacterium]|nr:GNAT family N-acetyltransferase [Rhodanobacteraceae bacterium]
MVEISTLYAPVLGRALAAHDTRLRLRDETDADSAFVIGLYTDVRWEELRPVDWPDAVKRDFLAQQSQLQSAHYRQHYPGAELLLILCDEQPIGRIYLRAGTSEVRLMDIALLATRCGSGIGGALVRALQCEAKHNGHQVTLHVEPNNPAQRLYTRLGFELIEKRGVYDFLGWPVS